MALKTRVFGGYFALCACIFPAIANATDPSEWVNRPSLLEQPQTIAEIEGGILALPNAPISAGTQGGQTFFGSKVGKGDATPLLALHLLYRGGANWVIGANAFFGPKPTSDPQYGVANGLDRSHSRNYFFAGGEARYVPLRLSSVEGWIGITAGGLVIADRFQDNSAPPVAPILGSPAVTVRTEGFAVGVLTGVHWMFADHWLFGGSLRADNWILPSAPQCTPIGDCATLTGRVFAFAVSLSLGYRIPL